MDDNELTHGPDIFREGYFECLRDMCKYLRFYPKPAEFIDFSSHRNCPILSEKIREFQSKFNYVLEMQRKNSI